MLAGLCEVLETLVSGVYVELEPFPAYGADQQSQHVIRVINTSHRP